MDVNVGLAHEALAGALGDREALVWRDRRLSWTDVAERSRRLANVLHTAGLGCHRERGELAPWESGQDHLGIYLHNGNEYLESMLGAFKSRVAPFNVNHRYVAEELRYLLADAGTRALVVHSALTPTLAEVLGDLDPLALVLQVDDGSGLPLLPGARWYEEALAAAPSGMPPVEPSPDDLYVLYTGGTTGMPKGVLWRQADAYLSCFGGNAAVHSLTDLVAEASTTLRAMPVAPLMHGAGQWACFMTWHGGGTVHLASVTDRLDPADVWTHVEQERITLLSIVGDAFARPLLDELDQRRYDLSSLSVVLSGGVTFTAGLKRKLLEHLPTAVIVDGLGSSEAGGLVQHVSAGASVGSGAFPVSPGSHVLSADLSHELEPGEAELGWLAKSGPLALGYLNDPERTRATYPVIDGIRYALPGDRAERRADGAIVLRGRDAVTINSGGEKIFAEEVEDALKEHHGVYDCVAVGRPSERWGAEVVAIVSLRGATQPTDADLLAEAERHIARYKLPKQIVRVAEVLRSPSGKADYRWAASMAIAHCNRVAPPPTDWTQRGTR